MSLSGACEVLYTGSHTSNRCHDSVACVLPRSIFIEYEWVLSETDSNDCTALLYRFLGVQL